MHEAIAFMPEGHHVPLAEKSFLEEDQQSFLHLLLHFLKKLLISSEKLIITEAVVNTKNKLNSKKTMKLFLMNLC